MEGHWIKETRKRLQGKKEGNQYFLYYKGGVMYDLRKKAQQAGMHDPAPDGRTTRRAKTKAKGKAKAKGKSNLQSKEKQLLGGARGR